MEIVQVAYMDIQDLRIFDRVAALQNLSVVGKEFSLTPGTISKRLQSLEDELGVMLFTRSTRKVSITEEGRIILDHAQRMLIEFETAKASIDGNRDSPRGLIKISAPAKLGNRELAAGLSAFMSAYPEINVHAEVCDRADGTAEDGFDITIKIGVLLDSSLVAKQLCDDPMVIVAAPDYLKLKGTPLAPQDLVHHSCLVHGDICHWPFRCKSAEKSVRVSGRVRSNDIELLRRSAGDGHGLARLSAAHVEDDIKAGNLIPVLTDFDTSGGSAIWAIFPKSKNMLPRMRVFLDFLRDWLKGPLPKTSSARLEVPARAQAQTPADALFGKDKDNDPFDSKAAKASFSKESGSARPTKAPRRSRQGRPPVQ